MLSFRAALLNEPGSRTVLVAPKNYLRTVNLKQDEVLTTANDRAAINMKRAAGPSARCNLTLPIKFVADNANRAALKQVFVEHAHRADWDLLCSFPTLALVAQVEPRSASYACTMLQSSVVVVVFAEYSKHTDQALFAADHLRMTSLVRELRAVVGIDVRVVAPDQPPPQTLSVTKNLTAFIVADEVQMALRKSVKQGFLCVHDSKAVHAAARAAAINCLTVLKDCQMKDVPGATLDEVREIKERVALHSRVSPSLSEDMQLVGVTEKGRELLVLYLTDALCTMPQALDKFAKNMSKGKLHTAQDVISWFQRVYSKPIYLRGGVPIVLPQKNFEEVERCNWEWANQNLPLEPTVYKWTREDQLEGKPAHLAALAHIATCCSGFRYLLPLRLGSVVMVTHDVSPKVLAGHVGTVLAFEKADQGAAFPVIMFADLEQPVLVKPFTLAIFCMGEELVHLTQLPLCLAQFVSTQQLEATPARCDLAVCGGDEPDSTWFASDPQVVSAELAYDLKHAPFSAAHRPVQTVQLFDAHDAAF